MYLSQRKKVLIKFSYPVLFCLLDLGFTINYIIVLMMRNYMIKYCSIFIITTFTSCSSKISGSLNKPLLDDQEQVFTVLNQIKHSKKDEYQDLLYKKILPALKAYKDSSEEINKLNAMVNENSFVIEPASISSDSTWMFVYIVKPYVKGATVYRILEPLKQMYGIEQTKEIFKKWNSCFASEQIAYWSGSNTKKFE
tara:strand:- start:459 stop:1046 length:588 start_codon:yes stop_codon:yes gene_type:complete